MAERFFNKIADDVEVATRQLQSLMFGPDDSETTDGFTSGGGGGSTGPGDPESSGSFTHEFDMSNMDIDSMSEEEIQRVLGEEMMRNNPLQDMANDVTKNIMAGQVRKTKGDATQHRRMTPRKTESRNEARFQIRIYLSKTQTDRALPMPQFFERVL